jgi:hypothetical protein
LPTSAAAQVMSDASSSQVGAISARAAGAATSKTIGVNTKSEGKAKIGKRSLVIDGAPPGQDIAASVVP